MPLTGLQLTTELCGPDKQQPNWKKFKKQTATKTTLMGHTKAEKVTEISEFFWQLWNKQPLLLFPPFLAKQSSTPFSGQLPLTLIAKH